MVTGDNALTARSIAARVGIEPSFVMAEVGHSYTGCRELLA
jgi:magnesium-transporting ATPase (P-type)